MAVEALTARAPYAADPRSPQPGRAPPATPPAPRGGSAHNPQACAPPRATGRPYAAFAGLTLPGEPPEAIVKHNGPPPAPPAPATPLYAGRGVPAEIRL